MYHKIIERYGLKKDQFQVPLGEAKTRTFLKRAIHDYFTQKINDAELAAFATSLIFDFNKPPEKYSWGTDLLGLLYELSEMEDSVEMNQIEKVKAIEEKMKQLLSTSHG